MKMIQGHDCLSRTASAFDRMPAALKKQRHAEYIPAEASPARGDKSTKRNVIPHQSWYPCIHCCGELKTLLVKTRLDDIYSRIDWEWHTASYIHHFLRKAKFIHGRRAQDTFIEYTPRGCKTPIHITMEKMATCLGLDLDGLFFDSASADEVYERTYFGPMKKSSLNGENYFDLSTAGTKALQSVGRFAVNVIYLGAGSSLQVSLICMKHLQCALAGNPVAWGKVLWEQLFRSIMVYQILLARQRMKKDCIRKAHFSALLLALLFRLEHKDYNPRLNGGWNAFIHARGAESDVSSTSESLIAELSDYDQESDCADSESQDGINGEKSYGLIQDMNHTESYYCNRVFSTEKAMVDQLANQDKELKSGIDDCPERSEEHGGRPYLSTKLYVVGEELLKVPLKYISQPPAGDGISGEDVAMVDHLTQKDDDELQVHKPKFSHLQGGSKMVGCSNDRHGKSNFNKFHSSRSVSKAFPSQRYVQVPVRYHGDLMRQARKQNIFQLEVMGGTWSDSTLNPKFIAQYPQAWQQSKFRASKGIELMLDEDLPHAEIFQQELDPMDNQFRKSLVDKSQSGEFQSFLHQTLLDSETSKVGKVDDDVLQLTQNLLQSFEAYNERKQEVNQDVGPSGLITDKSQSEEFESFLHHILLDPETSKAENVEDDVPQLTQNLLQSFEAYMEKRQKVNEDVCPSGLIQPNKTLQDFATCFSLDSRLEQAAEINGTELDKQVEDLGTTIQMASVEKNPALVVTSDDVKVISNLLKEQEKLITNLTEIATELKEYVCRERSKFCSLSDTLEQKGFEIDLSNSELKLERDKNLELEQIIEYLRLQANAMQHERILYKTKSDQLKEHKEMVADLTNKNSTLKRKLESMESLAMNTTEKAESTGSALCSVANVFKRLKLYF